MKKRLIIIAICVTIVCILGTIIIYNNNLGTVKNKKNGEEIIVEIPGGYGISEIAELLKESKVIKSEFIFKVYLKLNSIYNLQAGKYCFNNGTENAKEIVKKMANGEVFKEEISITFIEGKNIRYIAKVIAENTNNTEEEVFEVLENEEYINSLIDTYWFLTDEIKDESIYYSLEGYLSPNTYNFANNNVSVETIFKVLLDHMDKYLTEYKEQIERTNLTVHQMLTLASIAELEGKSYEDRAEIIGVFYNRINKRMSIGSDVTTYYAFKVDMGERDLTAEEIDTYNKYNTRGPNMNGKIPIGPISNPSKSSIQAVLNYKDTDAYYFVADRNGKVYFTKNYNEHAKIIKKIKEEGLWYTYE